MNQSKRWSSILLFPILLLSSTCNRSKNPFFYRIMDHLGEEDVLASPFKDLYDRLPVNEEWLRTDRLHEIEADATGSKRFLYELRAPLLDGKEPGWLLKLASKDRELLSGAEDSPGMFGWQLLKRVRSVSIDKTLFWGETFEAEIILPTGGVEFEIFGSSPQPHDCIPRVRFELNERVLGDAPIRDNGSVVRGEVKLGAHHLKLTFGEAGTNAGIPTNKTFCHVEELRIRTPRDVLVMLADEDDTLPPGGCRLRYLIDPSSCDSLSRSRSDSFNLHGLHKARERLTVRLEDLGIHGEPLGIKRKAYLEGQWANVLLAPPRTVFRCSLTIPSNSLLGFGYGALPGTDNLPGGLVRFTVTLIDGESTVHLFSESVQTGGLRKEEAIRMTQVDLACYADRAVSLVFETEVRSRGDNHVPGPLALTFWYDPIIYQPSTPSGDPNIILISLDTLRPDHLHCYGYPRNTSPQIDRVASEAVLFLHTFSPSSWTLPAHMSILTSLNVAHHGVDLPSKKLGSEVTTLADVLRTHEYVTGAFTGGGYVNAGFGFSKGFDFYIDKGVRSIGDLSQYALRWIRKNQDKKFFLFLHTYQPHDPYAPPARFGDLFLADNHRWKRLNLSQHLGGSRGLYKELLPDQLDNIVALYDGEIRYTDEELIGPLVRLLRELSLWDRTMFIITSDHGEEFHDHGSWFHGATLYNELIKVPLIVKFPNGRHGGRHIATYVRSIDIMPTVVEELGIDTDDYTLDGTSLLGVIAQDEAEHRSFVSEQYGRVAFQAPSLDLNRHLKKVALNTGKHKLILSINSNRKRAFFSPPPPRREPVELELYDLEDDPQETQSIADRHQQLVDSLFKYIPQYFQEAERQWDPMSGHVLDSETKEQLRALGYMY